MAFTQKPQRQCRTNLEKKAFYNLIKFVAGPQGSLAHHKTDSFRATNKSDFSSCLCDIYLKGAALLENLRQGFQLLTGFR